MFLLFTLMYQHLPLIKAPVYRFYLFVEVDAVFVELEFFDLQRQIVPQLDLVRPWYLERTRFHPNLQIDLRDALEWLLLLKQSVHLARDAHLLRFLFERQLFVDFPDPVEIGFDNEALHVNEPDA
jgi:hypothetical protein|tara:strand:- start:240 stop:614 length:375 start_codon:yes stop_codon:yes gene_type:complete